MKSNPFLQGVFGLAVLMLIVYLGVLSRNALAQYNFIGTVPHDRDTITIDGTGKVTASPDIAVLNLGVTSDGLTVQEVQTQNTNKMNAIIAAMKDLGVASADIQTADYNIYPKYDYSNGKQNIIGYTVSQSVTVKVRDLTKAGDVLAKAGSLGLNQGGGIQFSIDDPKALQAQARDKAIDDATTKAQALVNKLGLHIVKVVTFSEGQPNTPVPYPMFKTMDSAAVGAAAPPSPNIQSGSLDVTSDVSVTFQVN